jgi:hypothetical protein
MEKLDSNRTLRRCRCYLHSLVDMELARWRNCNDARLYDKEARCLVIVYLWNVFGWHYFRDRILPSHLLPGRSGTNPIQQWR